MTWGIIANFHQSAFESLKIQSLMGSFYLKQKLYELKIYRGVLCHDNEDWYQIWTVTDLPVQNWHEAFDKFWPEHLKIPKICSLTGCFWPKYKMFELKQVYRSCAWWHWRLMQNLKEDWLQLPNLFWKLPGCSQFAPVGIGWQTLL